MRAKSILLGLLACVALAVSAQPTQQATEWEWYMDEVVSETLVGRNYFEYYYMPSAKDMEQQRSKGEVSYFLNTPEGLNSKKVRDMIDRLMASYDDIKAVSDWHVTTHEYLLEGIPLREEQIPLHRQAQSAGRRHLLCERDRDGRLLQVAGQ